MNPIKSAVPDRSQEILDAALSLFTEGGFHNTRIEDIARRAGVAKGTVYLYFPGKHELFRALVERITSAHLAVVERVAKGPETLEEKLLLTARAHLSLGPPKQDITTLNLHEIIVSDDILKKKLFAFHRRYTELVADLLEGSTGRESAGEQTSRDSAVAFVGMLHAFKKEIMYGRPAPDLDTLSEQIVGLFLRGFEVQP